GSAQNFQTEVLFERIEIAVGMKERKTTFNTESGDPTIHSFANREALNAQLPIIHSTLYRFLKADHGVDLKIREMAFQRTKLPVRIDTLHDFANNQIPKSGIAATDHHFEQFSLLRFRVAKEIDPDGCVNDH